MQGLMLSRARWRTVALVAVGVGAGFVLGGMQQVSSRKIQAIALDALPKITTAGRCVGRTSFSSS